MSSVEFINEKGEPDTFYINDRLFQNFQKIKDKVNNKDFDQVFLIDGPEGSGKSVLGMQLAKTCDPSFSLERVCMNPTQFVKAIQTAQKGQVVIYDEAYTGLASRHSLSEVNKLIVSMMMEMRAKNLIVFIILPTFFMLDKYVAIFRSKGLFHTYLNKGRRGYWMFYNTKKKKFLYLLGKKTMSYGKPKVKFKGTFYGKYIINEEEYRKKKADALQNREGSQKQRVKYDENYVALLKVVAKLLNEKGLKSLRKKEEWFRSEGLPISRERLSEFLVETTGNTAILAGNLEV